MSVQVMTWVFEHSPHKGNDLLCLLAIADHAAIDGTNAYPAMTTLAQRCRISVRQVVRIIARLEASGAISINRSSGRHSNVYSVVMAVGNSDISDSPNSDVTVSPLPDRTVTFSTPNSDISSTNSDMAMSPDPIEPKRTNELPTTTTAREADEFAQVVNETVEAFVLAPWMNVPAAEVTAQVRRSFGLVKGFDPRDGPLEAENFVTWFAKKPPESWYRAWLNWLKKAVRYEQEQQSRTNANPDRPRPHGEPARTGRTSAGSAAGATGVDAGIAERGYSYDEIARRRAEASRARQDRSTAAGGGAGT